MPAKSTTRPSRGHLDSLTVLRRHPIFGRLPPKDIKRLNALAVERAVSAGSTIFGRGAHDTALAAVCSGSVKSTLPASEGAEGGFSLLQAGDIFGELVLLKGRLRTTEAVAETDCRLAVIKRDDLQKFVQGDAGAALKLIEVLFAQLSLSNLRIEEAAALSVPTRLARILLRLAESSTAPDKKLKVKQRELGHMVRASRETVNKHLRAWSKRKWIKHERVGIIVVDASALSAIARGDGAHRNGRMGRRAAR